MSAVATHCGRKRARSAMPPETMAGTAAAKVHRKKNLTSVRPWGSKPATPPLPLSPCALTKKVTP